MSLSTSNPLALRSAATRARWRQVLPLSTGLLAVVLLGACAGADPEPSPTGDSAAAPTGASPEAILADAGDDDACALLPQAELDAILGEPGTATPVPSGGWLAGQCAWSGPETGFFLSVGTEASISALEDPAEADAQAKLAAFTTRQADEVREINDVGDGAVAGPSGIAATVGSTYLELEVLSLTGEQPEQVMQLAIDNLPAS